MAREGYLILDSDLHMMEPDDLWVRYLDEPYRSAAQKPGEPPALQRRPGARFRSDLDLDSDGHRRDRRRRDVRHPRTADPVPRRSGARLRGGIGARLQQLGRRLLQEDPRRLKFAAQIAMNDVPMAVAPRRAAVSSNWAPSRSSAPPTRSTASICTARPASHCGTNSSGSMCLSGFIRLAPLRCGTMPGGAMSGTPISIRSPMRSAIRSS